MREEFEKLAAGGKIEGRHVEPLMQLTTNGFCMHRSWGFGRIKTVDTVFARFTIDFPGKAGHTMDLAFAAEPLKPIGPTGSACIAVGVLAALKPWIPCSRGSRLISRAKPATRWTSHSLPRRLSRFRRTTCSRARRRTLKAFANSPRRTISNWSKLFSTALTEKQQWIKFIKCSC